jgi:hypothetical protein
MTKPRRRTHKIHRKRGPRRGFKTRSQRGGFGEGLLNYIGLGDKGESKQGWLDWIKGNPPGYTKLDEQTIPAAPQTIPAAPQTNIASSYESPFGQNTQNPMQQTPYNPMQPPASMGGRKKCKRHHKHSRRCKK